jgi:hypothetical protein
VQVVDRRVRDSRPVVTGQRARDDPYERGTVIGREQLHIAGLDVLVAGLNPLLGARQVHPQLHAMEQPALGDEFRRRLLDVLDTGGGRHPLRRPIRDEPATPGGVLMLERAVDDVRDGLEPPVRMPGRTFRLTGRVLHRSHVVEQQEGVGQLDVRSREGTPYLEALPLEVTLRSDDLGDATPAGVALGQTRQTGQRERIRRDSGHWPLLRRATPRLSPRRSS